MSDLDEIEDVDESEAPPDIEQPGHGLRRPAGAQSEREGFIKRIAILTAHNGACEKVLRIAGAAVPPTPGLDQVRPTILAEGVVAELKRLQAELRIADEDLATAEKEADRLRAELGRSQTSGQGGGAKASPPPAAEVERHKVLERELVVANQTINDHVRAKGLLKDELAMAKRGRDEATDQLRKEQFERARLEREVRRLGDEAKSSARKPEAPAAPAAAPVGDPEVLATILRARGDAVGESFLRDTLQWPAKRIRSAIQQLLDAEAVTTVKLGTITQYKATKA